MQLEPFVTVVTPFYNTREFLAECIESVVGQTYENWEYILIDNQSTDGSTEIAEYYASRFPNKIRIIHTNSFLSQVQNYNFAFSHVSSTSKYCKMVQADDWIFANCIQSMVKLAEAHPRVGIVAAYELEGDRVSLDGLPYPSPEVSGREICRMYFLNRIYLFGTPTSLLFRSELVCSRAPFFEERFAPFEDAHACFDLLEIWNFGFVHQVLTYSRRDNGSILSRIRSFRFPLFTRLSAVVVHGRTYLSNNEYAECLQDAEREYFRFLGLAALQGKGEEFWTFHRNCLASIQYRLDNIFFVEWISRAILEFAGNPKRFIDHIRARRRKAKCMEQDYIV
jgi:glycosyltransferase involved in cell wall biosynthesis